MNFSDETEVALKDWLSVYDVQLDQEQMHALFKSVVPKITALHKREVERIIGYELYGWKNNYERVHLTKHDVWDAFETIRRRANGEGEE